MSVPPPCLVGYSSSSSGPIMVSRLPKFGSRSKTTSACNTNTGTFTGAAATRLTNGFYHHPGPAGLTGPASTLKQNGFLRAPTSISMKWRKDDGTPPQEGGANAEGEWRAGKRGRGLQNHSHHDSSQRQKELKKTTTVSEGKGRGFVQTATPPSWPSAQSRNRTLPVSKPGSEVSRPSQTTSRLNSGFPGSRPRSGTTGSLRPPQTSRPGPGRSRPGPGSPCQKKVPASRSHSSDGLGSTQTGPLAQNNRFRSQSLTQVRQQTPPLPANSSLLPTPTITRSSFNSRAGERATAQAPPTGGKKSPVTRQSPEGGVRGGGVRGRGVTPPSGFKKPLLPNLGPASRPSGISYKLSRPSLFKQARPVRVTPPTGTEVKMKSVEFKSTAENCSDYPPETLEGLSTVSQAEVSTVGETLEDMSMSSTSSLDREDDEFHHLGERQRSGGVDILLLSKDDEDDSGLDRSCARFDDGGLNVNGVAVATALCFLEEGVDWASMTLSGDGVQRHVTPLSRHRRSSHHDDHEQGGSSLDLSPSDSCASDGTYMWDEEGLQPLGGAITSIHNTVQHSSGSFDSDSAHSIDVLNDLDNLDSCDLEDDDLMLDADIAEDLSLHSDGDGLSHMAEWRRRQLCWGTQDVHSDSDLACYELTEDPGNKRTDGGGDVVLDLCPSRTALLSVVAPPAGVGVDVEYLAEECSAVRSQLKYLQTLLLQDGDVDRDVDVDTVSPDVNDSSQSSDSQVQLLLQEVQQLREELRSRDRTITHLLQMSVPTVTARCRCQETTRRTDQHTQTHTLSERERERESVCSQTPWREELSQIFDSSHQNQEPLMDQVSTPPPPAQAPPPAYPLSDSATDSAPKDGAANGKRAAKETGGGGGACSRSLRLPQPSKLRLLPPLKTNTYSGVTSGGHLTSLPRLCPASRRQRQPDGDAL